jgi:hypothetical protein
MRPLRSLVTITNQIENTYARWEQFQLSTGLVLSILKALVDECRRVTDEVPSEYDDALVQRVYDLVCMLRDNWRAHVDIEMARHAVI